MNHIGTQKIETDRLILRRFIMDDITSHDVSLYFAAEVVQKGGILVSAEEFKTGDTDFLPQLERIKEVNPDIIFMPIPYREAALITRQARDMGIIATFIGADAWASGELLTMEPNAVEGAFYVSQLDSDSLATDAAAMIAEAIEQAGSFEPEALRDSLAVRQNGKETAIIKISGGRHVLQIRYGGYNG